MLGVFRRDVNVPADPLAPDLAHSRYAPALKDGYLEKLLCSCAIIKLGNFGFMAYSTQKGHSDPHPRTMFSMRGGIYCMCRCSKEMMEKRKLTAGDLVGKESDHIIACYKDLIKQGKKSPLNEMKKVLDGDYNYILYDSCANMEGSGRGLVVVNCWDDMPVYYGRDSEGCCLITDCFHVLGKVCGELKSIRDIPTDYVLQIPLSIETDVSEKLDVSDQKEIIDIEWKRRRRTSRSSHSSQLLGLVDHVTIADEPYNSSSNKDIVGQGERRTASSLADGSKEEVEAEQD